MKVWCLLRDQFTHVKPVENYLGSSSEFVYDEHWDPEKLLLAKPDIVVCVNDFHFEVSRCLDEARKVGIPSLVLQDGILEWRCQYENPRFGMGNGAPQHQPVIADKIACIGPQSARQIAAWGNIHKVEVTGMPKLDDLIKLPKPQRQTPGKRVLVMTAKKPGFTQEQTDITIKSLQDLKHYFDSCPDIEVSWRITKGLDKILDVENQLTELSTTDLVEALKQVDAVISTPSTAMLESMLMKRPIAYLDYHNTPHFVQTAWTISSPEHIPNVISEILNPPSNKLLFQEQCLQDALLISSTSSSTQRVAELMQRMIEVARNNASKAPLKFKENLLGYSDLNQRDFSEFSLEKLYPSHVAFSSTDLQELQVRYARLVKEHELQKEQLKRRDIGYWMGRIVHHISRLGN